MIDDFCFLLSSLYAKRSTRRSNLHNSFAPETFADTVRYFSALPSLYINDWKHSFKNTLKKLRILFTGKEHKIRVQVSSLEFRQHLNR